MTEPKRLTDAEWRAEVENLRRDAEDLHDSDDPRAANLAQRAFWLHRVKPSHNRRTRRTA